MTLIRDLIFSYDGMHTQQLSELKCMNVPGMYPAINSFFGSSEISSGFYLVDRSSFDKMHRSFQNQLLSVKYQWYTIM